MTAADDHDRVLVARVLAGSGDAAEELVDRHWRACWRVARGILGDPGLAEDVVQEALSGAIRGMAGFDPRRGTFGAWLYRTTVNRALSELRRVKPSLPLSEAPDRAGATGPDDGFLDTVAGLRPRHRAVVVLRYGLDLTPPEIATVLDVPVGTVNSRLARALDLLRQTTEHPHVR